MPKVNLPPFLQEIYNFLFDFSAGENNRREVEGILLAVLAESKNDDDFYYILQRVIMAYEGDTAEGEARFYTFNRFMNRNRRLRDRDTGVRTRAQHLLADLPYIYGAKKPDRNSTGGAVPTHIRYAASPHAKETARNNEKQPDV